MKTLRLTICICIYSMMLCSCDSNNKSPKTNSKSQKESLTDKAWKLRNDGAPADQFINLQKTAVAELRRGESADDAVKVLEQMGLFYQITGDYTNALLYYQEASDSLSKVKSEDRGEGAIQLYGDLSSLYVQAGMQKEALAYNDSALAVSAQLGGLMVGDLYARRAIIYWNLGLLDSVCHIYDLGIEAVRNRQIKKNNEYVESFINAERAFFLLDTWPNNKDTVEHAVRLLQRRLEFDYADDTLYKLPLGEGLCILGNVKEGLAMMEETAEKLAQLEEIEELYYAYRELMQQYERLEMGEKMLKIYPLFQEMQDSVTNLKKTEYVVGESMRYETEKKNLEIEMLANKLALKRIQVTSIVLGSILIAIILLLVIVVITRRYKREQIRRQQALIEREELQKTHDENLKRTQALEQDLNIKMNTNSEILATPQLITNDLQGKFSRAFQALYPDTIPSIKKRHPDITPNDEMVCMLIYLKHTTDEIAIFLGISRQSVNTTRYRLRKKLRLGENEKLDEYIQGF